MYIQTLFTILCVGIAAVHGQGDCTGETYTVMAGDNCFDIGASRGVSAEAIIAASGGTINDGCTNLQPGQMICIPSA